MLLMPCKWQHGLTVNVIHSFILVNFLSHVLNSKFVYRTALKMVYLSIIGNNLKALACVPVFGFSTSVEFLNIIKSFSIQEGGDLSTLLESHFHNAQAWFFFVKEMPKDPVFILNLYCQWNGHRCSWESSLSLGWQCRCHGCLKNFLICHFAEMEHPLILTTISDMKSSWMAQRTGNLEKTETQDQTSPSA